MRWSRIRKANNECPGKSWIGKKRTSGTLLQRAWVPMARSGVGSFNTNVPAAVGLFGRLVSETSSASSTVVDSESGRVV